MGVTVLGIQHRVALRKESVDRNKGVLHLDRWLAGVALRKESVDRNFAALKGREKPCQSLSARRAWIEIDEQTEQDSTVEGRSPQGERG